MERGKYTYTISHIKRDKTKTFTHHLHCYVTGVFNALRLQVTQTCRRAEKNNCQLAVLILPRKISEFPWNYDNVHYDDNNNNNHALLE